MRYSHGVIKFNKLQFFESRIAVEIYIFIIVTTRDVVNIADVIGKKFDLAAIASKNIRRGGGL